MVARGAENPVVREQTRVENLGRCQQGAEWRQSSNVTSSSRAHWKSAGPDLFP